MGSDLSRITFNPAKRYTSVRRQQGRVSLDSDWNEQLDIAAHRMAVEAADMIGTSGAPKNNPGFQIMAPTLWAASTAFALGARVIDSNGNVQLAVTAGTSGLTAPNWPTATGASVQDGSTGLTWQLAGSDLGISPGRYYVDGLLCEVQPTSLPIENFTGDGTGPIGMQVTVPTVVLDGAELAVGQWIQISAQGNPAPSPILVQITAVNTAAGSLTFASSVSSFGSPNANPQLQRFFTYLNQPDYPAPPSIPATGTSIVYLDVWERPITALEDPDLLEIALGGPDTTTRTKTVWQVKLVDASNVAGMCCSLPDSSIPSWEQVIQPSAVQLTTGAVPSAASGPCSLGANASGYTGMENQFYRVEIHASGVYGWKSNTPYPLGAEVVDSAGNLERVIVAGTSAANPPTWPTVAGDNATDASITWQVVSLSYKSLWKPNTAYVAGAQIVDTNGNIQTAVSAGTSGSAPPTWLTSGGTAVPDGTTGLMWQYATPTFKWSRDNASVTTAVTGIASVTNSSGNPASQLSVESLGRDQVLGFTPGNWVEIKDDWQELNRQPGELHQIDSIDVAGKTITLDSTVSAASFPTTTGNTDANRHTRLTRWDQSGKVYLSDNTTVWVDLGANGSTGDIPLPAAGTTLLLENGITVAFSFSPVNGPLYTGDFWNFTARTANGSVESLIEASPRGVEHHYCRLGIINFGSTPWSTTDCRAIFPPAAQRPGIHITQVLAIDGSGNSSPLLNDSGLPAASLSRGIKLLCDNNILPSTVERATCFVTVEWPYTPFSSSDVGLRQFYMPLAVPAAVGAQGNAIFWRPESDYPTGKTPVAVVAADFNNDGNLDLAVVNQADKAVSILLGNGDGTFNSAQTSPQTGNTPVALAVADFNNDGNLDLAVVNQADKTVSILLGNGDGTFKAAPNSPTTGNTPVAVAVGYFKSSTIPDLAVLNQADKTVSILLGNGDGTFNSAQTSPQTGGTPVALAVGGFHGGGIPDLAVINQADKTVSILLGNGDGTFTAAANPPAIGNTPIAIAVADFNNDANLDLAVVNQADKTVSILLGNGSGVFTPTATVPNTDTTPVAIAIADFNADGNLDLAIVNNSSTPASTVSVSLGKGDGTFQPRVDFAVGPAPVAVVAAKLTSDGNQDLVVVNQGSNTMSILLGNGDGTFQPRVSSQWLQNLTAAVPSGDKGILTRLTLRGNFIWSQSDPTLYLDGDTFGAAQSSAANTQSAGLSLPTGDGRQGGDFQMWFWLTPPPLLQITTGATSMALNFGNQLVNTTSAAQTVTLTNIGNLPINIDGISITANFAQTNTCLPSLPQIRPVIGGVVEERLSLGNIGILGPGILRPLLSIGVLQPGASCTISVTFTPPSAGSFTGTLIITDNAFLAVAPGAGGTAAAPQPGPHVIALSGTGINLVKVKEIKELEKLKETEKSKEVEKAKEIEKVADRLPVGSLPTALNAASPAASADVKSDEPAAKPAAKRRAFIRPAQRPPTSKAPSDKPDEESK